MKKLFLLSLCLCLYFVGQAQETNPLNLLGNHDFSYVTRTKSAVIGRSNATQLLTSGSTDQIISNNVFLQGQYIEVGVSQWGFFGTTVAQPAGYHGNVGNALGFVADPKKDNWNGGTPAYDGDYFLPGSPIEGFGIQINGTDYNNQGGLAFDIPMTSVSNAFSSNQHIAIWNGAVSGLTIKQTVKFSDDATYFTIKAELTNTTGSTLSNVYYMRNVDPDNEAIATGNYSTINTIVYQPNTDPQQRALVSAVGQTYGMYLGLAAADSRARVTYGGFGNTSPSDVWNGTGTDLSQSGTQTDDKAISLSFNLGNIAPGETKTVDYAYILDASQVTAAFSELASSAVQTITSTSASLNASTGINGTGYYIVVPRGSTAPTADQIKTGVNYSTVTVVTSGSGAVTANTNLAFNLPGLTPGTNYDVYFVAQDGSSVFTSITLSQFTTAISPPSALSYASSPLVATINTTNVSASPTVTGTIVSYSISPALPTGVILNTTTGVISGTPTVASTQTDYTVTATNTGGSTTATFTLTTQYASQSITFGALDNKTYGNADYNPGATSATSGINPITYSSSNEAVATIVSGQIHIVGAGTTNITAKQAGNTTYNAATDVIQPLIVDKRAITLTADAKTKTYGNTDPALTAQVTLGTIVTGDNATGSLVRATGEAVSDYAISKGTYTFGSNYDETYVGANLTIGKRAITLTADAKTKTYGDTDPALTAQVTLGTIVTGDNATGSLVRATGEAVSDYAISKGTYTFGSNYAETYVGANLTIGKRAITLTADAKTKIYGNTDPGLTAQVSSGTIVTGDAATGSLTRAIGETVADYAISKGTYTYGSNYAETYVGANLTIGKRAITITADSKSKTYGDTDPGLTAKVSTGTIVTGDVATGSLARIAGETVADYAINKGTYTYGSNYAETYVGANLTISKRAITLTSDAKSKTYGTTDPTLTAQVTSGTIVTGDVATGLLARTAGETVADYAISKGTYTYGSNYAETYVGANLSIGKRAITLTADTKTKIYGSTDPGLTAQVTLGTIVTGDIATGSLTRAVGENVADYAISKGTYTYGSNYDETYVGANLEVTKAMLTATADNKTKVYGIVNPSLSFHYSGWVNEVETIDTPPTIFTLATSQTEVGTYHGKIELSGGTDNNYTFNLVPGDFVVTKAVLTATADNKTKVYGAVNPSLSFQYSGWVNGTEPIDTPPTISTTVNGTTNVGTYANSITLAGGTDNNYTFSLVPGDFVVTPRLF